MECQFLNLKRSQKSCRELGQDHGQRVSLSGWCRSCLYAEIEELLNKVTEAELAQRQAEEMVSHLSAANNDLVDQVKRFSGSPASEGADCHLMVGVDHGTGYVCTVKAFKCISCDVINVVEMTEELEGDAGEVDNPGSTGQPG